MIQVENLQKNYNGTRGLATFSLNVGAGELFGLVGPNGAGKTTLMKILATLLPADGGRARIAGHDVMRAPQAVRAVTGYLADVPGLYQDMQVAEFLEFFADAFHLKAQRKAAAVERALEQAGLAGRRDAFVEELSLGLKQRLVLAKTMLHDPKVLLLDEPATGLDPLARVELREQLKALNRQGVAMLISSHILTDLEDICTRVALIQEGHNAADTEGRCILEIREVHAPVVTCEIEVLGIAAPAAEAVAQVPGVKVLQVSGSVVVAEVAGQIEQAAALLENLVRSGVRVVRFDPRGPGLEERYRKVFGGPKL